MGLDAIGLASTPAQWYAGGSVGWRVAPRTRVGGLVAAGGSEGRAAVRAELTAQFLLNPDALRGVGLYGGGGLAISSGPASGEHLLLVLGIESRPGTAGGWVVEVGLGGGPRVALGWRWRTRRGAGR